MCLLTLVGFLGCHIITDAENGYTVPKTLLKIKHLLDIPGTLVPKSVKTAGYFVILVSLKSTEALIACSTGSAS